MKNSYIKSTQSTKDVYQQANTYLAGEKKQGVHAKYSLLPEEYAIFADLDSSLFVLGDTEQHRFLAKCLQHLQSQLRNILVHYGIVRVLPKLSITNDEDGAIVLNWAYTNFRIYLNFELSVDNSYYGIVAQNNEENIFTNSGKLNDRNYVSVIDMLLKYVIDNS